MLLQKLYIKKYYENYIMNIKIDNKLYKSHPIYDLYVANKNGGILHIVKKIPMKGFEHQTGYMK